MPSFCALARPRDLHRAAVDLDLPGVARGGAAQDADEGGLAGPVLAEQHVDLARAQVEVHAVEGDHAGVGLADPAQAEEGDRRPDALTAGSVLEAGGRAPSDIMCPVNGMTRASAALALLALLPPPSDAAGVAPLAPRPRLVLVLSVDQMRFDYLTRFKPLFRGGFRTMWERGRDLQQRALRVREHRDRSRPLRAAHRPQPQPLRDRRQRMVGRPEPDLDRTWWTIPSRRRWGGADAGRRRST